MRKRILVTGGAGFVGSHLCRELLAKQNSVICVDDLSTGSYENIRDLGNDPQFTFINNNIENLNSIAVDEIYNLACPASPCHYQKDPIKTLRTNFNGTMNLLNIAKENHAKLLQASTSEIYGNPEIHPQIETYKGSVNTVGPRACYDEGKRVAETLCYAYYSMYRTQIKIVRIFNTYGPGMQEEDGRVIPNFILQALNNIDITVYGEGKQTRSFCYIDDLLSGLQLMMNTENFCGPMNLGNPDEITILELANLIISITGSKSKIIFSELPKDDPIRRKPDIKLARKILKWSPTIDLFIGLKKTIQYFEFKHNHS